MSPQPQGAGAVGVACRCHALVPAGSAAAAGGDPLPRACSQHAAPTVHMAGPGAYVDAINTACEPQVATSGQHLDGLAAASRCGLRRSWQNLDMAPACQWRGARDAGRPRTALNPCGYVEYTGFQDGFHYLSRSTILERVGTPRYIRRIIHLHKIQSSRIS